MSRRGRQRDLAVDHHRVAPLPVFARASFSAGARRRDGDDQVEPPRDVHAYRPVQLSRLPGDPPTVGSSGWSRGAAAAKRFYDRGAVRLLRVIAFDEGRERERAVLCAGRGGGHHFPFLRQAGGGAVVAAIQRGKGQRHGSAAPYRAR